MLLNEEQVKAYGRELGQKLSPGDVVALVGELGAGKTTLAKAIAEGLGVKEPVTSPTFALTGEYRSGRLPLYHIDVYRLGSIKDFTDIGCDEYFYGAGVAVVEWADRIEGLLPAHAIRIELRHTEDPDVREVETASSPRSPLSFSRSPAIDSIGEVFGNNRPTKPLLAIETTGPVCSVALMTEDGKVCYRAAGQELTHLTSLIPMIKDLLEEAGVKPKKLGLVAVSAGPGSFTGIRIGVATARALAQSLDIPAIKVPTLKTFVYISGSDDPYTVACPIFDARRSQMYAGAFMLEEDGRIMTLVKADAYDPDEYFSALGAAAAALQKLAVRAAGPDAGMRIKLMGDGLPEFGKMVEKFIEDAAASGIEACAAPVTQDARATLACALAHGEPIPYEELEPVYIRKAEAQRRLDEKNDTENKPYETRPAAEEDVYGISIIERLSFGEPWLEQSILSDLRLEYSDYVVCESEGHITGYAGLHLILEEGHITNIAVHPASRRRGIGSAALAELMRRAEAKGVTAFTLEVRESDEAAIRFYEKQGFVSEGIRKDYYPAGGGERENARLMWLRRDKD